MSGYSILILINAIMCAFNAQTMIARTDLVQADGTQYMKVVRTRSKNADQWMVQVEAHKAAALQ